MPSGTGNGHMQPSRLRNKPASEGVFGDDNLHTTTRAISQFREWMCIPHGMAGHWCCWAITVGQQTVAQFCTSCISSQRQVPFLWEITTTELREGRCEGTAEFGRVGIAPSGVCDRSGVCLLLGIAGQTSAHHVPFCWDRWWIFMVFGGVGCWARFSMALRVTGKDLTPPIIKG
jgi:hypothetical protein